ncbi:MAG: alpha/beta fold hydrolase [Alphaproteobacteria bacterium]|nr:alpha/beta fold hydrolase [Alphaproteobacteria bacterium]
MLLATSTLFEARNFELELGGALAQLNLAYETYGTLNAAADNAILLCHGYTSSPHAAGDSAGWWHNLIGPGRAIDTGRYYVICSNMIGSAFGSTGPGSTNPATGKPYGPGFPDITTSDMVAAQAMLLDYLGVGELAAVVGFSYGGYLTFQWGVGHPDRMRALVPVATWNKSRGGPETITAIEDRFAQCPGWQGGDYYGREQDSGVFDMLVNLRIETLRGYGLGQALTDRLGSAAAADQELQKRGHDWAGQFDANALIALRKAAVRFNAWDNAANIKAPLLYVLCNTDSRFPASELAAPTMAHLLASGVDAAYVEIDSPYGHLAPTEAWQDWAGDLEAFLDQHAATS